MLEVSRDTSEGPIGIPVVYTSIAGMEMLSGYAPTTTTTTSTTTTSTISASSHGGEMVDATTKDTVQKLPLLSSTAGPRDGDGARAASRLRPRQTVRLR